MSKCINLEIKIAETNNSFERACKMFSKKFKELGIADEIIERAAYVSKKQKQRNKIRKAKWRQKQDGKLDSRKD